MLISWFVMSVTLVMVMTPLLLGLQGLLGPGSRWGRGPIRFWHVAFALASVVLFLAYLALPPSQRGPLLGWAALIMGAIPFGFSLLQVVDSGARPGRGPLRIWHVALAIALIALVLAYLNSSPGDQVFIAFLVALIILGLVLKIWRDEFVFLMSLSDDEFPGRHDKLVWIGMLTAFAPVGIWFFRAYHLAHWPEPAPEMVSGKVVPEL
jgi:hypothetical protein